MQQERGGSPSKGLSSPGEMPVDDFNKQTANLALLASMRKGRRTTTTEETSPSNNEAHLSRFLEPDRGLRGRKGMVVESTSPLSSALSDSSDLEVDGHGKENGHRGGVALSEEDAEATEATEVTMDTTGKKKRPLVFGVEWVLRVLGFKFSFKQVQTLLKMLFFFFVRFFVPTKWNSSYQSQLSTEGTGLGRADRRTMAMFFTRGVTLNSVSVGDTESSMGGNDWASSVGQKGSDDDSAISDSGGPSVVSRTNSSEIITRVYHELRNLSVPLPSGAAKQTEESGVDSDSVATAPEDDDHEVIVDGDLYDMDDEEEYDDDDDDEDDGGDENQEQLRLLQQELATLETKIQEASVAHKDTSSRKRQTIVALQKARLELQFKKQLLALLLLTEPSKK